MNIHPRNSSAHKCNQCGSDLILIKEVTQMVGEYRAPVTVTTYRCSDKTCQKDIDKKTMARISFQKQQDDSKKAKIKSRIKAA